MSDKTSKREAVLARLKARSTKGQTPKYRVYGSRSGPAKAFTQPEPGELRAEVLRPPDPVPSVLVSALALAKMQILVDLASQEVGWLGAARRVGNSIAVDDVFLFDQEVSGGHCEITTESQDEFVTGLLARPDGIDLANRIRFWGHSHGNGGTYPSGQDDHQVRKFHEQGAEYYLRAVCNRDGDVNFSFYDWERGMVYHHLPYRVVGRPVSGAALVVLRNELKAEFKKRVKKAESFFPRYGYGAGYSYTGVFPSLHNMMGFGGDDEAMSEPSEEAPAAAPAPVPDAEAADPSKDPHSWGTE